MAKGPRYRVPFRRRKEGKTNYRMRKALVASRLPRLVVRGTLKHMIVQLIEARVEGDKIVSSAHSMELVRKFRWKGACGNVPTAYLTGLLCGLKAVARGVKKAVLDVGLRSPTKGARAFAALKGALDAGLDIPHGEEVLPDERRLMGEHIADYAKKLAAKSSEEYKRRFSLYLAKGLQPEGIVGHFSEVRKAVLSTFKKSAEGMSE